MGQLRDVFWTLASDYVDMCTPRMCERLSHQFVVQPLVTELDPPPIYLAIAHGQKLDFARSLAIVNFDSHDQSV